MVVGGFEIFISNGIRAYDKGNVSSEKSLDQLMGVFQKLVFRVLRGSIEGFAQIKVIFNLEEPLKGERAVLHLERDHHSDKGAPFRPKLLKDKLGKLGNVAGQAIGEHHADRD